MLRFKNFSVATAITLFIIAVGALFVRLYGLSEYAFNDDELWHLVVADQKSLWDVIQFNFREEVHPPLSYIIWHFMLQISHNDLWLRMSSIIPGLLLIPSAYIFGRLYVGRAGGYCLALLFAFGAIPVSISTTIRAYSLMMLALTWAAIFLHKYLFAADAPAKKKSLIFYSLCALAAIELNHSACFAIFAFGLVLIFQTFKEKNKRDFVIIALIHAALGFLLVAYAYILKVHFGFAGIPVYFTCRDWLEYSLRYFVLFLLFLTGDAAADPVASAISLIAALAFILTPILLVRAKKWMLLHLTLTPIIVIIFTDYFRIYPFSGVARNNLFLICGLAILYAYFTQTCVNFVGRFCQSSWINEQKKTLVFLKISAVLILVIAATSYALQRNFFRDINPNCAEFSIKKSDVKMLDEQLQKKDNPHNVFVTLVRNVWRYRLESGAAGRITILTKNLGKFENGQQTIYFTAFPARERSITQNLQEHKLFFQDLFVQLKSEGKMDQVRSFTFFDIGFNIDHLTRRSHPQLIAQSQDPFMNSEDKTRFKIWQEGYDIGWAINRSNQVLDKFYFKDPSFCCGREIVVLSFTPKFVRDEILSKDFIDARKFEKEIHLK